jgi:hypothetical protein
MAGKTRKAKAAPAKKRKGSRPKPKGTKPRRLDSKSGG